MVASLLREPSAKLACVRAYHVPCNNTVVVVYTLHGHSESSEKVRYGQDIPSLMSLNSLTANVLDLSVEADLCQKHESASDRTCWVLLYTGYSIMGHGHAG